MTNELTCCCSWPLRPEGRWRTRVASPAEDSNLALKFLGEAQRLANRRATNYGHFDQHLRIADAFASLDPSRSFEVLDPGIAQLNELLSAAALLNGFEVNIFKDGELRLLAGVGSEIWCRATDSNWRLLAKVRLCPRRKLGE